MEAFPDEIEYIIYSYIPPEELLDMTLNPRAYAHLSQDELDDLLVEAATKNAHDAIVMLVGMGARAPMHAVADVDSMEALLRNVRDPRAYAHLSQNELDGLLIDAATIYDAEPIDILVGLGARVGIYNPFTIAAVKMNVPAMEALIRHARYSQEVRLALQTALRIAGQSGHMPMLRVLLDQNLVRLNAREPLQRAAERGHAEAARLIARRLGASQAHINNALNHGAMNGHLDVVEAMLDLGATDLNTALMLATNRGHYHVTDYLIGLGADIDG